MRPTLEELARVLALIHEAAAQPEYWTQALAALTRFCDSAKGSILDIDAQAGRLVNITALNYDPAGQQAYVDHYAAIDPSMEKALAAPAHEALTVYEHFSAAYRAHSEYFSFLRGMDMGDVLGIRTSDVAGVRSVLSLARPAKASGFDEQQRRLAKLLVPHIELAKRVQARVAEALAARGALAAGLDRLADAAFIVDATQKIHFLNAAAERLLNADARLQSRGGGLAFTGARLQSAFQAAVQRACNEHVRSDLLALPGADGEKSEVAVCPLHAAHPLASPWQSPLALVVIAAPRRDAAAIAARMRRLYDLTPAEAKLVAQLALGKSVEDIAQESGVQESTLRSQLRAIRTKTGVSRQAELVRLALGGAPLQPSG